MKRLRLWLVLILLGVAVPVQAQTILNNTTLAAAMTETQDFVVVASANTLEVGHYIVVPGIPFEAMQITALSGTRATVQRAVRGRQTPHANSSVVYTGPGIRFYNSPPPTNATCTRASQTYLPWFDLSTGIAWTCVGSTSAWRGAVLTVINYGSTSLPLARLSLPDPGPPTWTERVADWFGW